MGKGDHAPTHYHKRPSNGRTVEEDYASGYAKCVPPGRLLSPQELSQLRSELPQRLTRYREAADLTQAELAALLGVSRTAYSHYEHGRRIPDIAVWFCLARLFAVTLDELVSADSAVQIRSSRETGRSFGVRDAD